MNVRIIPLILLLVITSLALIACDLTGGGGDVEGGGETDIGGSLYYCPDGEHIFNDWYTEEPADCIHTGKKMRGCSSCDYYEEAEIPALGHKISVQVTDPTCNVDGEERSYCTRNGCDYEKVTVIPSGHVLGDWYESKAPTCEGEGEEKRDCTREGCEYHETREGADALDHEMGEWETTTAPSCADEGEETRKCTRGDCEYFETNTLASLGGHTLSDWYESKAPTCTAKGEDKRDCTREGCKYYETREGADSLGHKMGEWQTVQTPTCIHNGLKKSECERADCGYYETEKLPANGEHSYEDWYETQGATCTLEGEEKRDCKICGTFETRKTDILPHSEVYHEGKEPTCTSFGWSEYVTCENCSYTTYERLGMRHTFENKLCTVCGEREPSDYLTYTLSEDKTYYILTGVANGNFSDTEMIVASVYGGLPVKEIRLSLSTVNYTVTSLTIPKSITYVYSNYFNWLRSLEEVHIYDLTSWCNIEYEYPSSNPLCYGARLYVNGYSVKNLVIPDEVTEIRSGAFVGASGIETVTLHDNVTSIGDNAFLKCYDLNTVSIGKGVTHIAENAFDDCTGIYDIRFNAESLETDYPLFKNASGNINLVSLTIGKDVKHIPDNAFAYSNIHEVTFAEGCGSIGSCAFYDCDNIISITIPSTVTKIAEDAFKYCSRLVEVYNLTELCTEDGFFGANPYVIHTSLSEESKIWENEGHVFYISGSAYYMGYLYNSYTMTLPESCNGRNYEFHPYALINVDNVTELIVPDTFTELPEGIFSHFTSLERITIPFVGKSNSALRHEAHFGYIFGYTDLESSENFGYHYYDEITKLYYQYHIPSSLKSVVIEGEGAVIHNNAFKNCNIASVTLGKGVKTIKSKAFDGCTALSTVYLNTVNLNDVSEYSFYGAGNSQTGIRLYVGDKVESVASYLFYDVANLIDITFSDSGNLEYIGSCAFYGTGVKKVNLPEGVELGTSAFDSSVVVE